MLVLYTSASSQIMFMANIFIVDELKSNFESMLFF